MRKLLLSACLTGLLGFCGAAAAQQTLRFGVDPTFPPFESKAPDGTLQGFDIDLGNAICRQAKVQCEWAQVGFDGIIPALQAKKFDAILSAMSMTDKRRQQVAFSDMVYNTPSALVAPKGSGLTADIATLKGKNIGVAQGTIHESWANAKWAPAGVHIVVYPNQAEIWPDLATGRLDGTLTNAVSADEGFLNQEQGKDYAIMATLADKKFFGEGVGIGLRKDDKANLALINQALAGLHKNGEYERLTKKYFHFDVYPSKE